GVLGRVEALDGPGGRLPGGERLPEGVEVGAGGGLHPHPGDDDTAPVGSAHALAPSLASRRSRALPTVLMPSSSSSGLLTSKRSNGTWRASSSRRASGSESVMAGVTGPGSTMLAVMLRLASSRATERVRPTSPALAAA